MTFIIISNQSLFGGGEAKKNSGGLKGSDDETRIWVEGGVVLGVNPHKSRIWTKTTNLQCKACTCTFSFFISLIIPQLTSLCCNFSYGSKKGPAKYFWDTKYSGAIIKISPPLLKVEGEMGKGSAPKVPLLHRPCT